MLTALLGATLKDAGGQLTLQAQTESGVIDLLVCDYRGGELRGYVRFDARAARRAAEPALALRLVRQGLSRDHLRSGVVGRALSGDRAAGRRQPRRGGRAFLRPVRADSEPGPARGRRRAAMSPAASCSSICRKGRRGASGCTRGSIIRNGTMSASSPRRSAPPSSPIPRCRSTPCSGGCSTTRRRSACSSSIPLARGCRCNYDHVRVGARPIRAPRSAPRWSTTTAYQRRLRILLAGFSGQARATWTPDTGIVVAPPQYCCNFSPEVGKGGVTAIGSV